MRTKQYFTIYILLFIIIISSGCKKEEPVEEEGIAPTAEFTTCKTSIIEGTKINFVNSSTGTITSYLWNFGDNTTSIDKNPEHEFQTEGVYTVSLTVKNNFGKNTSKKTDYITVSINSTPPIANFVVDNTIVNKNTTIKFTNTSTNYPTTYLWNFGDETTSVFDNPFHSYTNEGTYTITLTVSNIFGTNTQTKTNLIIVSGNTQTVTDFDGNTYNSVQIGTQVWMKENLKTTHYANGTEITNVTNSTQWSNLNVTDKAYCYYNNSSSTANTYGALYTNSAATNNENYDGVNDIQGVCPDGWHMPSRGEWNHLIEYLGIAQSIKLKEEGYIHWLEPFWYKGGDNSSNFTALPGGGRNASDGSFVEQTISGYWWSSTQTTDNGANSIYIGYDQATPDFGGYYKTMGFSVRCIKN